MVAGGSLIHNRKKLEVTYKVEIGHHCMINIAE